MIPLPTYDNLGSEITGEISDLHLINLIIHNQSSIKSSTFFHDVLPKILSILTIMLICISPLNQLISSKILLKDWSHFFIQLIPAMIFCYVLIKEWHHQRTGGIGFLIAGLLLCPFEFNLLYEENQMVYLSMIYDVLIIFPFFIYGIMFLLNASNKKQPRERFIYQQNPRSMNHKDLIQI